MNNQPRKRASDFDPRILEIFDGYVHGKITKRQFIAQASRFTAAGVTGAMILKQLQPDYALAAQVAPDDPAIDAEYITYPSPKGHGDIRGLMVKPAGATEKLPAIVVVHENRGLNPYIEDVARRVGKAGYLALAPDGLTPLGGYPGNDDEGREMQKELDPAKLMEDFFAAFTYLRDNEQSTGKVGVVGFCYGGGVSNAMASAFPDLAASVPFYGRQLPAEDVPPIEAPLMLHYGALDERINAGWPDYEKALDANGKDYQVFFYENANHGFHNDTTPRYDPEAAELAWSRTMAFFDQNVKGG